MLLTAIMACSIGEKTTKSKSMNNGTMELLSAENMVFGFYNVENLFDTIDSKYTIDEEYLPTSGKKWDTQKYFEKINNLAKVISAFDKKELPLFLGMAEVENKGVVIDLITNTNLREGNYEVVHFESPDARGIDVSFMYRKEYFNVLSKEKIEVALAEEPDFATRDIVYVQGELKDNDVLHIFLNHWSSRRSGEQESEHKRVRAANILRERVDRILQSDENAKIIILGDFNDYPTNKSIEEVLRAKGKPTFENGDLFNMAYSLEIANKGTYNYQGDWGMLDQMIISKGLYFATKGMKVQYDQCLILQEEWMLYTDKKYGDQKPSRTYGGDNYYGGYSDHLPIYSRFKK